MRRLLALLAVLVALPVGACLVTPPPVEIHPFDPAPAPELRGVLAPNRALDCPIFAADRVPAPEELEFDAQGRLYTGTEDGEILRLDFDGPGAPEVALFARVGGRPNGVTFDPQGGLLVSDDYYVRAARVQPGGRVERLPWLTGQDAAVARDGRVFFPAPEDSFRETGNLVYDVLLRMAAMDPSGRLRVRDPDTGRVDTLVEGLYWPDGVALSRDGDFVAVVEVSAYRITRYWLAGPRAGTWDRLIENLPGSPDGFAADGKGHFYVSIGQVRNPLVDWFHRHPYWKGRMANLLRIPGMSEWLLATSPGGVRGYALVLEIDESGRILRSFHDPDSALGPAVNAAEPRDGYLYLASLGGRGIARCRLGGSGR